MRVYKIRQKLGAMYKGSSIWEGKTAAYKESDCEKSSEELLLIIAENSLPYIYTGFHCTKDNSRASIRKYLDNAFRAVTSTTCFCF